MKSNNINNLIILMTLNLTATSCLASSAESNFQIQRTSGHSPAKSLKIKKFGVPTYAVKSSKKIPRLDVGTEDSVVVQLDKNPGLSFKIPAFSSQKQKIETIKYSKEKYVPTALALKHDQPEKLVSFIDTHSKDFISITWPTELGDPKPKATVLISDERALIMKANSINQALKQPLLSIGLYVEALFENETTHHLNEREISEAQFFLADTFRIMGLYEQYRERMLYLTQSKDPEIQQEAVRSLVNNASSDDYTLPQSIQGLVDSLKIPVTSTYALLLAQFYLDKGNLSGATLALENTSEEKAQVIQSFIFYRNAKPDLALAAAENAIQNSTNEENRALAAALASRISFQKGDFSKAQLYYGQIPQKHSLWLETRLEMGWAQILSKDYSGAAGNMFSLQTDFFKNAYTPDASFIRVVSYLNLCQYGDALNSLRVMGQRYVPIFEKVQANLNQSPEVMYEQIKKFLQKKDDIQIPVSVALEMASRPQFLQKQRTINQIEEQNEYLKLQIQNLSKFLQQIKQTSGSSNAVLSRNKQLMELTQRSQSTLIKLEDKTVTQLSDRKTKTKQLAGEYLVLHLRELRDHLQRMLDQADVLQYEIYSGAGEQIRFQMATGDQSTAPPSSSKQISNQASNQAQPKSQKSIKWNFAGEVWEDEIGSFRSQLKNACPSEQAQN